MKKHLLLIAFVVLGLSSCKKEDPTPVQHKPITALELVKTKDAIIGEATFLELKISPIDMNGSGELVWTSSDETIATVNPVERTVNGLKVGTVTITVASKENPSITSSCTVNVMEKVVVFDDAVFEKLMLEKFDANKDKRITGEEVNKVTELSIPNIGTDEGTRIKSLKGIEAFLSLETLNVSENPALASLVLYEMVEDPASKADEEVVKIAVGATKIKNLNISGTAINTLVLNECKAIESLNLSKTPFTAFDFTKAASLKTLDISETMFAEADFSECAALETLTGKKSALKFADLSNNEKVKAIDFTENKSLEKVLHHKDVTPDANWKVESSTIIELGAYDPREIVIPDAQFKAEILANFDINGDGKIYAEEAANIESIIIDSNFGSITGSEKFPNLKSIEISDANQLIEKIDLTPYRNLVQFSATPGSAVKSVIFANCPSLQALIAPTNVEDLTITTLPNLEYLNITNPEKIKTLIFSGASKLSGLSFLEDATNLTSLEISECPNLQSITLDQATKLSTVTLKLNGLKSLIIDNIAVESLVTENLPALEQLFVENVSKLEALDLSTNTKLKVINTSNCAIKELDLSNNTALETVEVQNNKLSALNTEKLTNLRQLDVSGNAIVNDKDATGLDVSSNGLLVSLYFNNNQIQTLDVSANEWLQTLEGTNNPLAKVIVYKNQKTSGFKVPAETVFETKK